MRIYDSYGRLVVVYTMDFDITDQRYARKDASDELSGISYSFGFADANVRIRSGQIQRKNETTGLWHTYRLKNVDGIPTPYVDEIGYP